MNILSQLIYPFSSWRLGFGKSLPQAISLGNQKQSLKQQNTMQTVTCIIVQKVRISTVAVKIRTFCILRHVQHTDTYMTKMAIRQKVRILYSAWKIRTFGYK